MKRFLFSVLLLTTILALTCSATDTRVLTLGNANVFVKDDANIFLFPSTINMYRGLVVGDVATGAAIPNQNPAPFYRLGAHYDLGQTNGVFGVYIDNRPMPYDFAAGGYQPQTYWEPTGIGNRLNLFYGLPMGDMDLGANLTLYHNSEELKGDTTGGNFKLSNTVLGLELGATMMKNLDLAAGFRFGTWKDQDNAGADLNKPKSNFAFNIGGRYWWAFNSNVDFVPHLMFNYNSIGFSIPSPATEDSTSKTTSFDLGWGVNIRPVDRILLLFDLGIFYGKMDNKDVIPSTTVESKTTLLSLPYYKIGLEGHVTNWWDVRLGATKMWESAKTEITPVTYSYGTESTATYLGSGFHFGNLTLDAWIDPDFVLSGPNFISGRTDDLAMQVSVLYTWK